MKIVICGGGSKRLGVLEKKARLPNLPSSLTLTWEPCVLYNEKTIFNQNAEKSVQILKTNITMYQVNGIITQNIIT